MFRYLIFAYHAYDAKGGMQDCVYKTNSYKEVNSFTKKYVADDGNYFDFMEYYDTQENKIYNAEIDCRSEQMGYIKKKKFIKWKVEAQ